MVEFLKAVLFGIVEGITEWLPISSTGHMILLNEFVKLEVSEEFWEMFLVVIQLGAILAVVFLFWDQIWPFGKKITGIRLGGQDFFPIVKRIFGCCGLKLSQHACRQRWWGSCLTSFLKVCFITAYAWPLH